MEKDLVFYSCVQGAWRRVKPLTHKPLKRGGTVSLEITFHRVSRRHLRTGIDPEDSCLVLNRIKTGCL